MKQPVKKRIAEANKIDNTKTEYTLLVDGNNLMKISLVDKRRNNKGEEYGAILVFLRQLGNVLAMKDFNYCVVCWDGTGSGIMRWKLYPDYKANRDKNYEALVAETEYDKNIRKFCEAVMAHRKKRETVRNETEEESYKRQREIIQDVLEEVCVREYEFNDVEGDDIISYYVKNRKPNEKIVIMSSDKDLTQLISENVIVYNPLKGKGFINTRNSVEMLGITHENVVLEKILCGDASDNIKGVKGMGETTLTKYFPEMKDKKLDLETVVRRSKELLEERKANKQKPLKVLENIVNGVTDGCQGDKLYEVNRKIIDLSEPLMTDEAKEFMDETMRFPIDTSERSVKNAYKRFEKERMFDLLDEERFGNIFAPYSRIIMMEEKRYAEYRKANK